MHFDIDIGTCHQPGRLRGHGWKSKWMPSCSIWTLERGCLKSDCLRRMARNRDNESYMRNSLAIPGLHGLQTLRFETMGAMQYCIAYYSVLAHVHFKRPLLRGAVECPIVS